jgi:type VI secretion system protein ImpH
VHEAGLRAGDTSRQPPAPPTSERITDRARVEDLWDRLNVQAWGYDFFALVRRIEALHADCPGFGRSARASEDPLRFAQEPQLAFPPSATTQFHFPRSNAPARLFQQFMGLLGPMGPMPLHITEYALHRELHHKDRTLARFLDIFNHRMVSLFYRAWAASQMPASFDRAAASVSGESLSPAERERILAHDGDRYAVYIGSLIGLAMDEVRYRDPVPDVAKLHFAGRLAGYSHGPEGLAAILRQFFGVEASVEEFVGQWVDLPEQYWCRLGTNRASSTIGMAAEAMTVAGRKVWDVQGKFRVRLGPMSLADYERLLPGTPSARRLDAWIRNYVGDEFSWEAALILRAHEVPMTRLGHAGRLGWTTWVCSGEVEEDREDLVIHSPR